MRKRVRGTASPPRWPSVPGAFAHILLSVGHHLRQSIQELAMESKQFKSAIAKAKPLRDAMEFSGHDRMSNAATDRKAVVKSSSLQFDVTEAASPSQSLPSTTSSQLQPSVADSSSTEIARLPQDRTIRCYSSRRGVQSDIGQCFLSDPGTSVSPTGMRCRTPPATAQWSSDQVRPLRKVSLSPLRSDSA